MAQGRIDSWWIGTGETVVRVRLAGVPPWVDCAIMEADLKAFNLAGLGLQVALNAAALPGIVWTVTATGDSSCTISTAGGNVDLEWLDAGLKEYFGFLAGGCFNFNSMASTTYPAGRFTPVYPILPTYYDLLLRQTDRGHAGAHAGTFVARLEGQRCSLVVGNAEMAWAGLSFRRGLAGVPWRIWLDKSLATFSWGVNDWRAGRDLAIRQPAGALDLQRWLSLPAGLHRTVEWDCIEVSG